MSTKLSTLRRTPGRVFHASCPQSRDSTRGPEGKPLAPNSVTKAFRELADSLGLSGVRFHDLRHGHATIMLRQGVHPKIVSERLGHTSINITLDTYAHVLPGLQAAAALRFDEAMREVREEVVRVPR